MCTLCQNFEAFHYVENSIDYVKFMNLHLFQKYELFDFGCHPMDDT